MQCEQWGGFRFLLEGCQFTAFVDHKPLKFTMAKTLGPRSGSGSSQHPTKFTMDIQHVAGKKTSHAGCLSRAGVLSLQSQLDLAAMSFFWI